MRRLTEAQAAAAELELALAVDTIRSALTYEQGYFRRAALKIAIPVNVLFVVLIAGNRAACTPGGVLEPQPTSDCTSVYAPWLTQLGAFNLLVVLALFVLWTRVTGEGIAIPRCSKPIYPLLSLLTASAIVTRPTTRYTEAIKLSQQISRPGPPLRTVASNAAADFGNRRALRSELATHLNRVDAAFIERCAS
ncbi:hypothetical protein AB0I98_36835 [Streptomyces sp. NPDC050211]|uniref:hypothetical protein n=1 Tax=Streptomyces sp. NPDC050211 TaxID=3154932 RepID=UPI003418EABE